MNGVIPSAVRLETAVSTAILGQSNNFIPRYISQPNVTTFKTPAIVQGVHSVHLLMLNVRIFNIYIVFVKSGIYGVFLAILALSATLWQLLQQFPLKVYKSTKCNNIQNTSYCPRGAFCACAHV